MDLQEQYAQTLIKAFEERDTQSFETFFDNFIALLKQKRHLALLPRIMHKVKQLATSQETINTTVMIVRDKAEVHQYENLIQEHADVFDANYQVREDPQVVGGVMIKNRSNMLDASYRSALHKLYKSLTQ